MEKGHLYLASRIIVYSIYVMRIDVYAVHYLFTIVVSLNTYLVEDGGVPSPRRFEPGEEVSPPLHVLQPVVCNAKVRRRAKLSDIYVVCTPEDQTQ